MVIINVLPYKSYAELKYTQKWNQTSDIERLLTWCYNSLIIETSSTIHWHSNSQSTSHIQHGNGARCSYAADIASIHHFPSRKFTNNDIRWFKAGSSDKNIITTKHHNRWWKYPKSGRSYGKCNFSIVYIIVTHNIIILFFSPSASFLATLSTHGRVLSKEFTIVMEFQWCGDGSW